MLMAHKGNLMVSVLANGYSSKEYKELKLDGLKDGMCYEVLDACIVAEYDNQGEFKTNVELILLQKPAWAKDEDIWTGKWGNNSPEWTFGLRE